MGTTPLIIGHRGASRDAPENTMAAFRLAWEQGADGIEADFRLTGDNRIACIHDDTTGRTTGADLRIDSSSLAELRRLDAGKWKGEQWAGERIPLLEEVFDALPKGKRLFVEIKSGPEIVPPLARLLADSHCGTEQLVFLSFSAPLIGLLKERLPEFRACWLCEIRWNWRKLAWSLSREDILATLNEYGADGLACRSGQAVDVALSTALRGAGFELHIWTVDSVVAARRFAALGVCSIFTNRPGWMRERLERG